MDEIVKEFLVESTENLNQLDRDLVALEKDPGSPDLLGSVFRTIHTIKGVSGFLGYQKLGAVTHSGENLLSKLRDKKLILNAEITSGLLAMVDAVRRMLASVEADGTDGEEEHDELIRLLTELERGDAGAETPAETEAELAPALEFTGAGQAEQGSEESTLDSNTNSETEPIELQAAAAAADSDEFLKVELNGAAEHLVPHKNGTPASNGKGNRKSRKSSAKRNAPPQDADAPSAEEKSPVPTVNAADPVQAHRESRPAPVSPKSAKPAGGAPERAASSGEGAPAWDASIRVNVSLLDKLMNLVGELVLTRNQILQFSSRQQDGGFVNTSQRLNLITTELQEGIMKTRMQPIGNVWNKFPRLVRDLALACGKQVRIEMEGEETELDKTLIEAIRDPLTHIVRNSIDHGIEAPSARAAAGKPAEGRLFLRAFHESGTVNIQILDDGAGIDFERVKEKALERGLITRDQAAQLSRHDALALIFAPGFSTARQVTSVSGRGVGMDVVKTNIEKIGGTVDIHSERGQGTTLKIKIPLTLAIIPALIVTCDGDRYAIPQVSLIELVRLESNEAEKRIETVDGAPVYRLRGRLLPLVYLSQVLKQSDRTPSGKAGEAAHIVVLQVGERQFGLVVDEVNDTEEIVVKPLSKQLKGIAAFAGATIMGDGRVALILDSLGVAQISSVLGEAREASRAEEHKQEARASRDQQRLLLFRAAGAERLAVPSSLVARLEEFPRAQIEHAAGTRVIQYRDKILPLIELGSILGSTSSAPVQEDRPVQVVVIADGDRTIGVEVDQIVDIVEEQVSGVQMTDRPGLLCSAIVGGKVTDFLDLRSVIQAGEQTGLNDWQASTAKAASVLLVEDQMFSRGLLRSYLEMADYSVTEACDASEAGQKLAGNEYDVALVSLDLPEGGAFKLLDQLHHGNDEQMMPALALTGGEEQPSEVDRHARFDDYQAKFDRQAIIKSIAKLVGHHATSSAAADHQPEAIIEV
jgi:two-component system chemotaxis sensor kinase CheA